MPNIKPGTLIPPGTPVVYGERTESVKGSVGVVHYEIVRGVGGISTKNANTMSPLEFLNSSRYKEYIASKTGKNKTNQKDGPIKQSQLPAIPQNIAQVPTQNIPTPQVKSPSTSPQLQSLPQRVMSAPPKQVPQIQSYPSYSQGQSYIIERPIMMMSNTPSVKSSGTNTVIVQPSSGRNNSGPHMGQIVNNILKSMLLTTLSSS
jgi:hypothetical protein